MTERYIDIKKGENTLFDIYVTKITYNEWHAMILGLTIAIVLSILYTQSELLSILLFTDLALSGVGRSFILVFQDRKYIYSYIRTVGLNPWYYLSVLCSAYLTLLCFQVFIF